VSTARPVTHLSLHRIAGTELRVVSDVEAGVLPLSDLEETVIRRYIGLGHWPHRWVTLFLLQDLAPLARQLTEQNQREAELSTGGLPGSVADPSSRPVVCVYDLADPANCHVFVSQQALSRAGLWGDSLAVQALLAHEHAHPLAENALTRLSRQLRVELALDPQAEGRASSTSHAAAALISWLDRLVDEFVCYAPRELLANELMLRAGWANALEHLDRCTLSQALQDLRGREQLADLLKRQTDQEGLTPTLAAAHLLSADLRHANLALEVASFARAGQEGIARQLDSDVRSSVLARLDPQVASFYDVLIHHYAGLEAECDSEQLVAWGQAILQSLTGAIAAKGLQLVSRLYLAQGA